MTARLLFYWVSFVCLLFVLVFMAGLSCGDDDDDDDDDDSNDDNVGDDDANDDDNDNDIDEILCPDDLIDEGKEFLMQGKGEPARSVFLAILDDYSRCDEAHFGVALADQLQLFDAIDELLLSLFDPFDQEKSTVNAGALVVAYMESRLEPLVDEILDHLAVCREATSFHFEIERLPFELLGLDFLVYAGQYDRGDVLLQSAQFLLVSAALDTVLSADLGFDYEIVLAHAQAWATMDILSVIVDVIDLVLDLLDDPRYPNFLTLRPQGTWRMPQAGLAMGYACEDALRAIDFIRTDEPDSHHGVSNCGDRNGNGQCDPDEFIHGVFYSLPSDLHSLLQDVERALRNSYWDGTILDVNPDAPDPFSFDVFNPILGYFGWPNLMPNFEIDLGELYANPDPNGIRDPLENILKIIQWFLDRVIVAQAAGEKTSEPTHRFGKQSVIPNGPAPVGLETVSQAAALPYLLPTARSMQLSSHDPTGGNDDGFFPPNHLYIDEHGEFVIFDQFGPGCIYRFQITHTWSFIFNFRLYVDDMETPVFEGPFWMIFFLAPFEPFTPPLTQNMFSASGTNFCYRPIPFKQRCKITVNTQPEFFSFTYVKYDADTPVTSFTGREDDSLLRSLFANVGHDPKPNISSTTQKGSQVLSPGEAINFLQASGKGAVWRLYLDAEPFTQVTFPR